ncbi:MAG: NCS2 family permease [Alphaproteobacteria bacterium]|nr:NCS2 family permease [Alphaproteobacteria bacterium]MDE2630903.1 NCS2 family permease [Alphaproteobacteria bacterium]
MFEEWFDLTARGTTVQREIVAGVTTFCMMGYIMFVNPQVLAAAGMDTNAVFVATCLSTAIATLLMGLYAKLPVALAPGVSLSTYFAYTVVPALNGDWRTALGCAFVSGVLFVLITLTPLREWLVNAIPRSLKLAIAAGIGFFLALIGLYSAGIVVPNAQTLVQPGLLTSPTVLVAAGTFVVIFALAVNRVTGAVLIGIVGATAVSIALGLQYPPVIASAVPSLTPTFLAMQLETASPGGAVLSSILVFLLIEMLDTSGTLTALAYQGNLLNEKGRLPYAGRALTASALGTMAGAALGTSPVTAYIESSTGIQAGGRTGLTAIVVGLLFLASLSMSPLIQAVPPYATGPALIFVAALMVKGLKDIDWDDMSEAAPALLTALAIPFTYSITTGIGIGFLSYVAIKIVSWRWRDLNFAVIVIAAAFAAKTVWA